MFERTTLPFFMILIIMGSYLKHMDVVIFSSCAAPPLGHSLFSYEELGGGRKKREKEKKNFHMLTFTQWFLLIAPYFLICPGLMLLKVGLAVFYWSQALCRTQFSWLPGPCSSGSFLPDNLRYSFHSLCQTCHTEFGLGKVKGTHWLGELPPGPLFKGGR